MQAFNSKSKGIAGVSKLYCFTIILQIIGDYSMVYGTFFTRYLPSIQITYSFVLYTGSVHIWDFTNISVVSLDDKVLLYLIQQFIGTFSVGQGAFTKYLISIQVNMFILMSDIGTVCNWDFINISDVCLDDKVKIEQCTLTEQGLPVISLNTGSTYTYSHNLGCWYVPIRLMYTHHGLPVSTPCKYTI